MASEMYSMISNQVKTDDFASSFNVQSGALNQVNRPTVFGIVPLGARLRISSSKIAL
jgi:hypothetical protein